jgi:hypothetical protein
MPTRGGNPEHHGRRPLVTSPCRFFASGTVVSSRLRFLGSGVGNAASRDVPPGNSARYHGSRGLARFS